MTHLSKLHTNQRLLLEELERRGVTVEILVPELELVEARFGAHTEILLDRDSSVSSYSASVIAGDKYLTKRLLARAGLTVPQGEQFFGDQREDALRFAAALEFPLVVKPSIGSHGEGCVMDLGSMHELEMAMDMIVAAVGPKRAFLIERQHPGMEFRVFITKNGDYAVLHRDPASVTGDGVSTIAALAAAESERRRNPRTNSLCPIVIDGTVERCLHEAGLSLSSVPRAGAKVYLRRNSNVAQGGNCEDYTERVHSSVVSLARKALDAIPGLPYAGVDLLSTDISAPQERACYCILELNSNPGIHMHMRPGKGRSRNVASYLADIIFPETRGEG